MDNDLISRSELKKAIQNREECKECTDVDCIHCFYDIIDNAPTVEHPQGKWIDYSNEGYVECPFCGSATTCEDNKDELHYCWNCGAEMKND